MKDRGRFRFFIFSLKKFRRGILRRYGEVLSFEILV